MEQKSAALFQNGDKNNRGQESQRLGCLRIIKNWLQQLRVSKGRSKMHTKQEADGPVVHIEESEIRHGMGEG